MKSRLLILLFLVPMLSGCLLYQKYEGRPDNGAAGLNFYSDYEGTRGDQDDVLYMRVWQPSGEYMTGIAIFNNERRDLEGGGGSFPCPKYDEEWKGKPWWMEIVLYTERDFEVEVDRIRIDDSDCIGYAIEIASDGTITNYYEGYPPWHPDSKRLKFWVQDTLIYGGLAIGVGGFGFAWFWAIRRMKNQ